MNEPEEDELEAVSQEEVDRLSAALAEANRESKELVRRQMEDPTFPQRMFGSAGGLIKLAEDFDEPLEDFLEYT